MARLDSLEKMLGVTFRNIQILKQALIHRSYLHERPGVPTPSNERLEFLGDAILGMIVTERLYECFPKWPEGELTKLRAALVRKETLDHLAVELNLGKYLFLGRGEAKSGGRAKPSNLASALEAVLGAIYLDQGMQAACAFTLRLLDPIIESHTKAPADYKSTLQELLRSLGRLGPSYRVAATCGPNHARRFTVEVLEGDTVLGAGSGHSKKAAEMAAAQAALERIQVEPA